MFQAALHPKSLVYIHHPHCSVTLRLITHWTWMGAGFTGARHICSHICKRVSTAARFPSSRRVNGFVYMIECRAASHPAVETPADWLDISRTYITWLDFGKRNVEPLCEVLLLGIYFSFHLKYKTIQNEGVGILKGKHLGQTTSNPEVVTLKKAG